MNKSGYYWVKDPQGVKDMVCYDAKADKAYVFGAIEPLSKEFVESLVVIGEVGLPKEL